MNIHPPFNKAFEECKREFGDNIFIISNSCGSLFDPKDIRANELETTLNIKVIRHFYKPFYSSKLMDQVGFKPNEVAYVGDRIFTDVLFANSIGMRSIYVMKLVTDRDGYLTRMVRKLEEWVLRIGEGRLTSNDCILKDKPF